MPTIPSDDHLAWLAGLTDAEGCFGLRRHLRRKTQVLANAFVGMADVQTVEFAKGLAEALYGKPLTTHRRPPNRKSKQPFYSFNMTSKRELFVYLRAVLPYLRIKRTEALLQYDFLSRAAKKRHIGTEHDFWLCEMSRRIKDGDESAKTESLVCVRDDFSESGTELAWLGGYTDGDGSISMAHGSKTILLSYGAMSRPELERAKEILGRIAGKPLPAIREYKSELSDNTQWRLDLREIEVVDVILRSVRPHLRAKGSQADLASLARSGDRAVMDEAITLIQDLNHGRTARDVAQRFLEKHTGP